MPHSHLPPKLLLAPSQVACTEASLYAIDKQFLSGNVNYTSNREAATSRIDTSLRDTRHPAASWIVFAKREMKSKIFFSTIPKSTTPGPENQQNNYVSMAKFTESTQLVWYSKRPHAAPIPPNHHPHRHPHTQTDIRTLYKSWISNFKLSQNGREV